MIGEVEFQDNRTTVDGDGLARPPQKGLDVLVDGAYRLENLRPGRTHPAARGEIDRFRGLNGGGRANCRAIRHADTGEDRCCSTVARRSRALCPPPPRLPRRCPPPRAAAPAVGPP